MLNLSAEASLCRSEAREREKSKRSGMMGILMLPSENLCGGERSLVSKLYYQSVVRYRASLRGRRSKGKGKGIIGSETACEGGGRRGTPARKPLFSPSRILFEKK